VIEIQSWLNTAAQLTIAGGVAYGIYQRVIESRAASARGREITGAAVRAEEAAREAAAHAETTAAGIEQVATAIAEVKEQTNGMSHRLEALAGEAGEGRGRAQAAAEAKDKS